MEEIDRIEFYDNGVGMDLVSLTEKLGELIEMWGLYFNPGDVYVRLSPGDKENNPHLSLTVLDKFYS